jgi:ATP-dependent helicase/nuclease subunit A
VLDDNALNALFGPGSRAEVSIAAEVSFHGQTRRVIGQIDRLVVGDDEIIIADFKSGAPRSLDETPVAYVAQLALYASAVGQLWPGRAVRTFLVWTAGPVAVELPEALLEAALARLGMDAAFSRDPAP